ncbi:MAG: sigma factor [Tannerellaceae bacterium]
MNESETFAIDALFWKIALKDGEGAFRTLFFQFFSPLCVFAHLYIDDWDNCEDIVQETFFKIWKNRKRIEINTSSRNFLITSVKNSYIDFLRKQETEQKWQQQELESNSIYTDDLYSAIELEQNISVKTVEAYITKALKHLRIQLKDYAGYTVGYDMLMVNVAIAFSGLWVASIKRQKKDN